MAQNKYLLSIAFLILPLLLAADRPQSSLTLVGVGTQQIATATATPGFVGASSKNSTLVTFNNASSNGLGSQVSGICFSFSYCIPLPEPALAGNLVVLSGHYDNGSTSTATTITCHDDQSDTFTTDTHQSVDTGSGFWGFSCYTPNVTAAAHIFYATFGTTAVTQVAMQAEEFYNIATSSPLDVSTSCAGTSSSTANCASVTTTQTNDLCYNAVVRAGTPAVTSYTKSSGFTLGTTDINDGSATQWEVDSSTGSITPAMTMASSSTYLENLLCFKSATAGHAPSGLYIAHLMSWGPQVTSATSFNFQFPSTGNLLMLDEAGGLTPGAVPTDGTNTWTTIGINTSFGGNISGEYYVPNATANATGLITAHTTGSSSDTTFTWYDFQNAPSAPFVFRSAQGSLTAGSGPTYTQTVVPYITNGVVMMTGAQSFNTFLSWTPSGAVADVATWGNEPVNGGGTPSNAVDQNNIWGHYYLSDPTKQSYVWTDGGTTSNSTTVDFTSFLSSTGIGVVNQAKNQATSGTDLQVTVPSTTSGNLLAISTGFYDGATLRTVSKVCTGTSTTCATGTQFTQASGATSAGVANTLLGTDIWYLLSAPSGVTTVTVVYSGATTNNEVQYWEVAKGSGGAWATDGANTVHNGASCSTTCSGGAITPSVTTGDFCLAHLATAGTGVTANPKSGNAWVFIGNIFNTGSAATSLLTLLNTSQTPQWTAGAGAINASDACFK